MSYNFPENINLISTQTASSSSALSFTSVISSSYNVYFVSIRNLIPATDNVSLALTFSTDNGSTYLSANYFYTMYNEVLAGETASGSNSTSSCTIADKLSNNSARGLNADFYMYNLANGSVAPYYVGLGIHYNKDAEGDYLTLGGSNSGTTAINAIKFAMSSGNITSGSIYLYGLNEAI